MEEVVFFVAAFGAIAGALGVILVRNPFYSVLMLVVHLFALATLFLLLNAEFIAAAQIVVYAGAVMVLYVFVVAYIGGVEEAGLTELDTEGAEVGANFGSPGAIGQLLLQKFLITFESASILLLVAAVGAVVLARKRRGLPEAVGLASDSLGASRQAPESQVLGGQEAEPTRPPAGTPEGPQDPVPDRGTWN